MVSTKEYPRGVKTALREIRQDPPSQIRILICLTQRLPWEKIRRVIVEETGKRHFKLYSHWFYMFHEMLSNKGVPKKLKVLTIEIALRLVKEGKVREYQDDWIAFYNYKEEVIKWLGENVFTGDRGILKWFLKKHIVKDIPGQKIIQMSGHIRPEYLDSYVYGRNELVACAVVKQGEYDLLKLGNQDEQSVAWYAIPFLWKKATTNCNRRISLKASRRDLAKRDLIPALERVRSLEFSAERWQRFAEAKGKQISECDQWMILTFDIEYLFNKIPG